MRDFAAIGELEMKVSNTHIAAVNSRQTHISSWQPSGFGLIGCYEGDRLFTLGGLQGHPCCQRHEFLDTPCQGV